MPSPIFPFSAQNQLAYTKLSRQVDLDLILSRIRNSADETDASFSEYDKTLREYKAKKEERRQNAQNRKSNIYNSEVRRKDQKNHELTSSKLSDVGFLSEELKEWAAYMKLENNEGKGLEYSRNISFGVFEKEVIYGSNTLEPYPNMKREKFSYRGGKDDLKRLHGTGFIDFGFGGSTMSGSWDHGRREGRFKIETNRKGIVYIEGDYANDKLNGKVKVCFKNRTWLEGFFKDGVLHGFCRYFDEDNNLTFVGMHRNGIPVGTCWKFYPGGGCVVGRVDSNGKHTGSNIIYLYPDFKTALVGHFVDGEMVKAQECQIVKVLTENQCIKVPKVTKIEGHTFLREISTSSFVTHSPTLRDPYESAMIEVKESNVFGASEGIFAKTFIKSETVVAFYQGLKLPIDYKEDDSWEGNEYKIFDPSRTPEGTLDIPKEFLSSSCYSASLAHKTNHSFNPNCQFQVFDHPRWGIVPCISTIKDICEGEELFVKYGYDPDYSPTWYQVAWQKEYIKGRRS